MAKYQFSLRKKMTGKMFTYINFYSFHSRYITEKKMYKKWKRHVKIKRALCCYIAKRNSFFSAKEYLSLSLIPYMQTHYSTYSFCCLNSSPFSARAISLLLLLESHSTLIPLPHFLTLPPSLLLHRILFFCTKK